MPFIPFVCPNKPNIPFDITVHPLKTRTKSGFLTIYGNCGLFKAV